VRVKHKLVLSAAVFAAVLVMAGSGAGTTTGESGAPERGLFAPGESLGGVRIGMTQAAVLREWGDRFGRCRDCPRTTWYFNYRPFLPQGVGVGFERGRVTHVFTLWQPQEWRTPEGLVLGDPAADIARTYGPLDRRECARYYALVDPGARTQSVYYVFDDEVWGFALTVPDASPCL
jgi:hypothetical protein